MRQIVVLKPGDAVNEYNNMLNCSSEFPIYDSGKSYIESILEATQGSPLLVVSLGTRLAYKTSKDIKLLVLPVSIKFNNIFLRIFNKTLWQAVISVLLLYFSPNWVFCVGPGYHMLIPFIYSVISCSHFFPLVVCPVSSMFHRGLFGRVNFKVNILIFRSNFTNTILCRSNNIKNEFNKIGVRNKKFVVYMREYKDDFFQKRNNEILKGDDNFKILFIGRIENEQKQVFELVDIAKYTKGLGLNIQYYIIGDGPDFEELSHRINKEHLSDTIHLLGYKHPDLIWSYLKTANLMIITSKFEGLCKSGYEAMLAGLPIISSKWDGITQYLKDGYNGLLVDIGDIKGYVNAILQLYNKESLFRKIRCNAQRLSKEYLVQFETLSEVMKKLLVS